MKPNCYQCQYRGTVPGDAHSCCHHPSLNNVTNDPIGGLIDMISSGGKRIQTIANELKIQANYHGIKRGWFMWPFNFDPIWLENCEGFLQK